MQAREQDIRHFIVSAIEAGQYPGGSRLPTERALCETLSVSRSAVRGALAVLEGEGRIYRVGGSGTYVSDSAARPGQIDVARQTSPAQVMEARIALEPPMAHLVCANANGADFADMQACLTAGAAATAFEVFEHWDGMLHKAVATATKNPLVIEAYMLVTKARDGTEWGELKRRSVTLARREVYRDDHDRIVAALMRRDARAAEAEIRAHLLRVRDNLLAP